MIDDLIEREFRCCEWDSTAQEFVKAEGYDHLLDE